MEISIPKTLLVGLGGSGGKTLRRLRKKFQDNFGKVDIPCLDYLVIDVGKNCFGEVDPVPPGGDLDCIDMSRSRQTIKELYKSGDDGVNDAFKWLHPRLKDLGPGVLEKDASGIRSFGKLTLMLELTNRQSRLVRALKSKLRRLHENSEPSSAERDNANDWITSSGSGNTIDVLFVCSCAGGSGAGFFIDLAYYIQGLFKNDAIGGKGAAKQGNALLYLYLPDVFSNNPGADEMAGQFMTPGSYAALSELEHYQADPGGFCFDGGARERDRFRPDWKPLENPAKSRNTSNGPFFEKRPFDFVYLIGDRTENGAVLQDSSDAFEMTADKIFTMFVEPEHRGLLSANHAGPGKFSLPSVNVSLPGRKPKEYNRLYGGFGLSRIFIDVGQEERSKAFELVKRFIGSILDKEVVKHNENDEVVKKTWRDFGWNIKDLFHGFSKEMLKQAGRKLRGLQNAEMFHNLVSKHEDSTSENVLFGRPADNDIANWEKRLIRKLNDNVENRLIEVGLRSTLVFLDTLVEKAEKDNKIVKKILYWDLRKTNILAPEFRFEILKAHNKKKARGRKNVLGAAQNLSIDLYRAFTVLDHIAELEDIGEFAAKSVRADLKERFWNCFLSDGMAWDWKPHLINSRNRPDSVLDSPTKQSRDLARIFQKYFKPDRFKQKSEIKIEGDPIEDFRLLLIDVIKKVLQQIDEAQNILINLLKDLSGMIGSPNEADEPGDFARGLMKIASSKANERRIGAIEKSGGHARYGKGRARCRDLGPFFLGRGKLKKPDRDAVFMLETLKDAYKTRKNNNEYAKNRIWDLVGEPNFADGLERWLSILVKRGASDLKEKPRLKVYYKNPDGGWSQKLEDNISLCLKTSAPYHRLIRDSPGIMGNTEIKRFVFAPRNMMDAVKRVISRQTKTAHPHYIEGRREELVFLTLENCVALPFLKSIDKMPSKYHSFSFKEALWTNGEHRPELLCRERDERMETEIIIGVLLGVIWFDRSCMSYRFGLEHICNKGITREIPLGKSILEVKSFFLGPKSGGFIDAVGQLVKKNSARLSSRAVQRKITPLIRYYRKTIFIEASGRPSDHYYLKELAEREKAPSGNTGGNDEKLLHWLHAFCEMAPSQESRPLSMPDIDWFPVLMPDWNPEKSRETLLWHNAFKSPGCRSNIDLQEGSICKYAMDVSSAQDLEGKWDGKNPTNIPPEIIELAWD